MGKKKKRKKRQRLAKKLNKMIESDESLSPQDLIYVGMSVFAKAADKGSRKVYRKAAKRGRTMLEFDLPAINDFAKPHLTNQKHELEDPVISYQLHGGGWYEIMVGDTTVTRVQGEEEAAAMAGELLERYAALDANVQGVDRHGAFHVGGGWYEIVVAGVPIDRIQGRDAADERLLEVAALN